MSDTSRAGTSSTGNEVSGTTLEHRPGRPRGRAPRGDTPRSITRCLTPPQSPGRPRGRAPRGDTPRSITRCLTPPQTPPHETAPHQVTRCLAPPGSRHLPVAPRGDASRRARSGIAPRTRSAPCWRATVRLHGLGSGAELGRVGRARPQRPRSRISRAGWAGVACQKRAAFPEPADSDGSGARRGLAGARLHDTRQPHQTGPEKSSQCAQNCPKFQGNPSAEPPDEPTTLDATSPPLVPWHGL